MTSIVTDLTGDDDETDETIICKRCTFINSSFLNYCELCEAPLKNNFMLNNNNQSPEGGITRKKELQSEHRAETEIHTTDHRQCDAVAQLNIDVRSKVL